MAPPLLSSSIFNEWTISVSGWDPSDFFSAFVSIFHQVKHGESECILVCGPVNVVSQYC